jgi:DNA repair exonuclease SbcCD ATPase subunit
MAALRDALNEKGEEIAALRDALKEKDEEIAARKAALADKDRELDEIKNADRTIAAVLQTKVSLLERELAKKAENEETAHLLEENARLAQEKRDLEREIYEMQENNPELQAALEDRKVLKRENTELNQRVVLLEQQLRGEDLPLLPNAPADGDALPFQRGLFRQWQTEGGGYSVTSNERGGQNQGIGALFVDPDADNDGGEVTPLDSAFQPLGEDSDGGLFDDEEEDD